MMGQLAIYTVLVFFVLANLALGVVVIRANVRSRVNIYFSLFVLFVVLWIVMNALADASHTHTATVILTKLTMAISAGIPYFILLFVKIYPENSRPSKGFLYPVTVFYFLINIISLFGSGVIEDANIKNNVTEVVFGSMISVYGLFFICAVLGALLIITVKYIKSRGGAKQRLTYLLFGLSLSLIGGSITNLILPIYYNNFSLTPFGPITTSFLIYSTTYAILKHQLFDIRVVIRKILVYSTLLAIIFGIYSGVVAIVTRYLPINPAFGNFMAAILIAIGFDPLRRWLQAVTEKFLFVAEYDPDVELKRLSQTLTSVIDLDEALRSLMQITTSALRLGRAATLVLAQEGDATEQAHLLEVDDLITKDRGSAVPEIRVKRIEEVNFPAPKRLLNSKMTPVLRYFKEHPTIAVVEMMSQELDETLASYQQIGRQLKQDHHQALVQQNPLLKLKQLTVERLQNLKVAVVIPIVVSNKLIGIVFLGEKLSNDSFYEQDLNFLTIVGGQTANAIEKARFFEEDQLKSEFVSIASHELLTPTAAIEGYLSMILEEHMGQVDEKASEYLWKVFNSSKRLSNLVKDLLSVSRIESGRIKIEPKMFDLNEVVSQQLDQLQVRAKEANLYLKVIYPKRQALVFADPERIAQAVVNLAGNSLKYTKEGGLTVTVVEKPREFEVQFTDTGIGISEEGRQHLFEKFSRIETTQTTGIMGTGLGLYITKAIVEMMGGGVWVKSVVGKGSTFAFTVPKQKPTRANRISDKRASTRTASDSNQIGIANTKPVTK